MSLFASQTAEMHLAQILDAYQSYQAKFVQTSYDNNGAKLGNSTGKMALLRPGYFRWETITPTKQIIVTDSKNIWIYDVDLEQVTIEPMKKHAGEAPAVLLTDTTDEIIKTFNISEEKTSSTGLWFTLIPKTKESLYQEVRLYFINKRLEQMILIDSLGQKIAVQFITPNINPKLPKNTFQEKIPKDVDVIGKAI